MNYTKGAAASVEFGGKTEAQILNQVINSYNDSKSSFEAIRNKWIEIKDAYEQNSEMTLPDAKVEPKSKVSKPVVWSRLNRATQTEVDALFNADRNFITARLWETGERAYDIENYLFRIFKQGQYALEVTHAVLHANMYNFGVLKLVPDYKLQFPIAQLVNNFDLYFDPSGNTLQFPETQFIQHRVFRDIAYLKQQAAVGVYDPKVVAQLIKDQCNDEEEFISVNNTIDPRDDDENEYIDKYNRIRLIEDWREDYVTVIAFDKYILRRVQNVIGSPFYPVKVNLNPNKQLMGKGNGEYLLPIEQQINLMLRRRDENVDQIVNAPMLIMPNMLRKRSDISLSGGNVIEVNSLEGIKPLQMPDVTRTTSNEVADWLNTADEISGINQVMMGQAAKGERMTTTEAQGVYGASQQPFNFGAYVALHTCLIPMFKGILRMVSLMLAEAPMALDAPPGSTEAMLVPLTPEVLEQDYELVVNLNPVKEEVDRQNASNLYQMASGDPYVDPLLMREFTFARMFPDYPRQMLRAMPAPTGEQQMLPSGQQMQ